MNWQCYFDNETLEVEYKMLSAVACEWKWCLVAGNYEEKAEAKRLLDEYVKLPWA